VQKALRVSPGGPAAVPMGALCHAVVITRKGPMWITSNCGSASEGTVRRQWRRKSRRPVYPPDRWCSSSG